MIMQAPGVKENVGAEKKHGIKHAWLAIRIRRRGAAEMEKGARRRLFFSIADSATRRR
jgi:hypothetical protein